MEVIKLSSGGTVDLKLLTDEQRSALLELIRRRKEEPIRYFKPNAGAQVEFFNLCKEKREVAYFAGNKSGKTHCGAKFIVQAALGERAERYGLEVLYREPIDIWVGSVDYRIQRESAQREVEYFLPQAEIKKPYMLQNGILDRVELVNGSTIGFKTYEQGRKAWQGPKRHIVWFDEEPPEDIVKEGMSRLISKNAKLIFTMTPLLGQTFVHKKFIEEQADYRGYVYGSTYENRAHLTEEYLRSLEDLGEDDKAMRLHGQFLRLEGLVFKEFNRRDNLIPHIEPDRNLYTFIAAWDFGADHPTAFLIAGIDAYDNIYIFREYKESNNTIEEHARAFKIAKGGLTLTRVFGDPSAKQWMKEMRSFREKELRVHITPAINDRSSGISLINSLFKQRKLFISENCPQLLYELEHHRYKPKKIGQRDADVIKTDDDLCDALRYLCSSSVRSKLHSGYQADWGIVRSPLARTIPRW
jgi:PBSX family phage terminase large subunit